MIRTIGIDPGSRYTGYGIVEGDGNRLCHLANGAIHASSRLAFPDRLKIIYEQLTCIIERCRPDCMAIEDVFFAKNVKSALKLGQARGAAMLAGINAGLPIFEYSALEIKQAVVGYGRAEKEQVAEMMQFIFGIREPLDPNAADALAAAVCHLNTRISQLRWKIPEKQ